MRNKALIGASAAVACGLTAAAFGRPITIGPSAVPFNDISVSGTLVGATADDAEFNLTGAQLTGAGFLGNDLVPNGMSLRVGNNGGILIGNSGVDTFVNATEAGAINHRTPLTMPGGNSNFGTPTGNGGLGAPPRQYIMPLWDDMTTTAGGGTSLRWQVIAGDLYVQWSNEDHFNATGTGVVTFQMVARGGATIASGNPLIDYVYNDTLYQAQQYQNDGGSATIAFKNWGINANANDVEFGQGGGGSDTALADPAFGDPTMKPKVGGWASANDPLLPHSVTIAGTVVPEPASLGLISAAAVGMLSRRRRKA